MNTVIKEVVSRKDLKLFVRFPDELFQDNPNYVPALHSDEFGTLSKDKNPAFQYCDVKMWLAYQDERVVGRVCAIINHKANALWNTLDVRFGWLDAIDDYDVFQSLLRNVADFGRSYGMKRLIGPMGFTNMDKECWVTDGFDQHQNLSTIYNPPYYVDFIQRLGYEKECEWKQFKVPVDQPVPAKVTRLANVVREKYGLRVLKVKHRREILPYGKKFFQTLNQSYKDIFGFIPLSSEEIDIQVQKYFSFINLDLVCFIVDRQDDVIGFGIGLPDLSVALKKAKGSLLPFAWVRLLYALNHYDRVDLLLTGVRPDWQKRGVHALFHQVLHETAVKNGVKEMYTNPQIATFEAIKVWENQYESTICTIRRAVFYKNLY